MATQDVQGGNPWAGLGIGLAGLGLTAFGAYKGSQASKAYNAAQTAEIGQEQSLQNLQFQAMTIMNQRQQRENVRNVQRAQSLSVAQAVGSGGGTGAFAGSALGGSLGGEAAQGGINTETLSQNLQFGAQANTIQNQISSSKIAMANAQLQSQNASATSGIGGALMAAAPLAMKALPLLAL